MGFVAEERRYYTVYPPPHQVFTLPPYWSSIDHRRSVIPWDRSFRPSKVAHGLCFSVQRPVPPPPSLENIYEELSTDIDGFVHPDHEITVLTIQEHQANSQKEKGWEQFTDVVVSLLNQNSSDLVFLLWGSYAQKKGSAIDRKRHHVLQTAHPSPLSCTEDSLGADIARKPTSCCKSLARSPSAGRICDPVLGGRRSSGQFLEAAIE
ncbi:hypothetical protein QTO34_001463, partial [Cnephaeus nilssonii]